jgi:hypothetical protein
MKQGHPHPLEPASRIARRILVARAFVGPFARAAFLSLALASGLAGTGCADILGLDSPHELKDSSSQDRPDSVTGDGMDSSEPDRPDSATGGGMDSSEPDETDSVKKDGATDSSPRDASADIVTDAHEGGAPTDQTCGVCVSGTSQPCGANGTQTCSSQCTWGACSVPNTVGCSDGTRDGFLASPGIAGCLGDWNEGSMRAPKTGTVCGNAISLRCPVPADLCAAGWHVCGTPPYEPTEISAQITNAQCTGETTGSFLAALGDQECEPCSSTGFGAVCCGSTCIQQNGSCVWTNATPWAGDVGTHTNLCSDVYNTYPTAWGALCCLD